MFNWSKSISDPHGYLNWFNVLNENFHLIMSDIFLPSAVKFIFTPCLHVTFLAPYRLLPPSERVRNGPFNGQCKTSPFDGVKLKK